VASTALQALTGLLTPPGMNFKASEKRFSEFLAIDTPFEDRFKSLIITSVKKK
jgi:hypothetical protein